MTRRPEDRIDPTPPCRMEVLDAALAGGPRRDEAVLETTLDRIVQRVAAAREAAR